MGRGKIEVKLRIYKEKVKEKENRYNNLGAIP